MDIKFNKAEKEVFYALLKLVLDRKHLSFDSIKDIKITLVKK